MNFLQQSQLSCLALIVLLAGCQSAPNHPGLLETTTPETTLSSRKLRSLLTEYVPRFADQIEECADHILAESNDTEIQRNALLWKSNAISACFQAATRPDSLAAFLDVWILNRQMTQLLERPRETPLFGPWQELAIRTSHQLEHPLLEIQSMLGTGALPGGNGVMLGDEFVANFASNYPVRSLYFDRQSLAAPFIQQVDEETREILQVVSGLNESLAELQRLSALYAEFLPKQARWQSELFLLSSTSNVVLAQPLRELNAISTAMDRMATTAESSSALLERERLALSDLVADERAIILRDVERMRGETLEYLLVERIAVMSALRDERTQIETFVAAVTGNTLDRADRIIEARTQDAMRSGGLVVEQAIQRITQAGFMAGVMIALVVILFQRLSRQRAKASLVALPNERLRARKDRERPSNSQRAA